MERKTNWLAVILSAVVAMAIGMLWYGGLFTEQWMAGNGITMEGDKIFKNNVEMSQSMTPMLFNTVSVIINALILNWIIGKTGARTWMDGAMTGGAIGVIMTMGVITGNLFAQNPSSLSMVDGSYPLVAFTLMGAILGGWQKK